MARSRPSGASDGLELSRTATKVNATAIGIRSAVLGASSDFPSRIARVGRSESVVPIQVFRITVSTLQVEVSKVVGQFARVVFDFFRAWIVAHDKSTRTIPNRVDKEARRLGARQGHVIVVALVVDARGRRCRRSRIRRWERLVGVHPDGRRIIGTRLNQNDYTCGGISRAAVRDRHPGHSTTAVDGRDVHDHAASRPASRRRRACRRTSHDVISTGSLDGGHVAKVAGTGDRLQGAVIGCCIHSRILRIPRIQHDRIDNLKLLTGWKHCDAVRACPRWVRLPRFVAHGDAVGALLCRRARTADRDT